MVCHRTVCTKGLLSPITAKADSIQAALRRIKDLAAAERHKSVAEGSHFSKPIANKRRAVAASQNGGASTLPAKAEAESRNTLRLACSAKAPGL